MNDMFFDPELLKLWDAQAMLAPQAAPAAMGFDLAKVAGGAAAAPLPLPPPEAAPPLDAAPGPNGRPEPLDGQDALPLLTRLGLTSGGMKDRRPVDVAAFTRQLAEMLSRPAPRRPMAGPAPAPTGHRPQGGTLPMRQAAPGNPYLRGATPGAAAIRPRRRGLLDEG